MIFIWMWSNSQMLMSFTHKWRRYWFFLWLRGNWENSMWNVWRSNFYSLDYCGRNILNKADIITFISSFPDLPGDRMCVWYVFFSVWPKLQVSANLLSAIIRGFYFRIFTCYQMSLFSLSELGELCLFLWWMLYNTHVSMAQ